MDDHTIIRSALKTILKDTYSNVLIEESIDGSPDPVTDNSMVLQMYNQPKGNYDITLYSFSKKSNDRQDNA